MNKTFALDVGKKVKNGLDVFDQDGKKLGFVDYAGEAQGWMQVGVPDLDLQKLWLPYRLIKSVDDREVILTATKHDLRTGYKEPPERSSRIAHRHGKTIVVTMEPNGYDGTPIVVKEVDLDEVRQQLAVGQRVWTADAAEVGKIKEFDSAVGYALIERGILSRKHDLLVPVHLVAEVNRDSAEVTLVVREADLKRMQHVEAASIVIDMPAYLAY